MRRLLDILEEKARRRAILFLCPQIDDAFDGILQVSRDIGAATDAIYERVAQGEFSAPHEPASRAILDAEGHLTSPLFVIKDLRYGTPYASTGYGAPGRWGNMNRRRNKKRG